MPLLPFEMLRAKKHTSIPFSIVFTLGFAFESFKEFGGASLGAELWSCRAR